MLQQCREELEAAGHWKGWQLPGGAKLFVQPQQYERYRGSLYSHLPQMTQSVPVPVPVPAEAHVDVAQSHACGAYAAAACGGAGGAGVPAGAPPALAQQAAGSGGPGHLRYE